MTASANFIWPQGADLPVELIYKEGDPTPVAIDLSTGYAVRMDIVVPSTKERVYTFNSVDIPDVDPIATGSQDDAILEGTLSSGAGGTPNITILVPRSLTLPGGAVYTKYTGAPSIAVFNFDIFLRNTVSNKQSKILTGTVTIEDSSTLWL